MSALFLFNAGDAHDPIPDTRGYVTVSAWFPSTLPFAKVNLQECRLRTRVSGLDHKLGREEIVEQEMISPPTLWISAQKIALPAALAERV